MKQPREFIGRDAAVVNFSEAEWQVEAAQIAYKQQWAVVVSEAILAEAGIAYESTAPSRNITGIGLMGLKKIKGYHATETRVSRAVLLGELEEPDRAGNTHRYARIEAHSYRDFGRRRIPLPVLMLGDKAFDDDPRATGGNIYIVDLPGGKNIRPRFVKGSAHVYYAESSVTILAFGDTIPTHATDQIAELDRFVPKVAGVAEALGLELPPYRPR